MLGEIMDDGFAAGNPHILLDEARAVRLVLAAERLREVQALAGAFAATPEGRTFSVDDLLNVDRLFSSATQRAGEALFTLGNTLGCEGVA